VSSPERRPSADELDRLVEQVRRDPGSRAFVALGEAYLALGRPRDAVEIGVAGLRSPRADAEMDGRVMVARALAALHQWKEAQAELLKVVKVDRNHRGGFTLLGEVLLRRGDYERALPVLQHAQNLEPSNPAVLAMLRKARAGQPLDPPPPIPTPADAPRSGKRPPPPRSQTDLDEGPTRVDDRANLQPVRGNVQEEMTGEITDEPGGGIRSRGVPPAPAAPPAESLRPNRGAPRPSAPPPMGQVAQAAAQMQARRGAEAEITRSPDGSRTPAAPPAVRPRVIGGIKQVNPAAEALRQSAAAGENYLNDLLTGGLLEVPGVRVPDSEFDIRPDRRWGRSAGRMFTALFVLLVLGAGGGVAWWYYSEQAKTEAVKKHRAAAAALLPSGSFDDLNGAAMQLGKALERDRKNTRTFAQVAEVTALQTLLYGFPPINANDAIAAAARDIDKPEEEGYRELVIARTAVALATLSTESDADASLAKARAMIEEWLVEHGDDRWARWLQARAMLAAGERAAARTGFQAAADGADGLIPAMIDLADLLVDDGRFEEAQALYGRALEAEPGHPLALVGQVLAWAERGAEKDKALGMLNVDLPEKKNFGPRVRAYRQLALGLAKYQIEEFEEFNKALTQAIDDGPSEPRYLGRVALARLLAGDFPAGVRARGAIAWFGKGKPESDPVVQLFDATLLVESGLPARALDVLGALEGTRAHLIRAQALIDLGATDKGKLAEAVKEAEAALAGAPENAEAQALAAWAKVLEATGSERDKLIKGDLNKIANAMVSKRGRHAEGAALYGVGSGEARQKLEQALANIDGANPNPIAYRTHTLLARLDLAEGKLAEAGKQVEDALAANGGYLPAMVVRAKIFLAGGDADTALAALGPVLTEAEAVTWEVELAHAEALAARPSTTEADRGKATEAVKRAKEMGAPASEVGRVAALINPDLPDALGVPAPLSPEEQEKKDRKKRRR
jgi:tetratricopeptide (TPR) repeat protein